MKHEPCDLIKQIPKELIDKMFENADIDVDYTFLCFEEVYKAVTEFVPKDTIIIDFGCAYAFQSWYFKDYKKYIGVEIQGNENSVLKLDNSEFYFMSIQEFISEFDKLGYDKEKVFAVCSYVTDKQARQTVRENFPNCLVYYP